MVSFTETITTLFFEELSNCLYGDQKQHLTPVIYGQNLTNFMDKEKTFWLFDICVAHKRENHWERHDVKYPFKKKKKKKAFSSNSLLDTELGFTDLQKLSMKHVCGTVAVKHSLQSNRRFVSLCYVRILSRHQGDVLHINPCISLLCDCLTFADRSQMWWRWMSSGSVEQPAHSLQTQH